MMVTGFVSRSQVLPEVSKSLWPSCHDGMLLILVMKHNVSFARPQMLVWGLL